MLEDVPFMDNAFLLVLSFYSLHVTLDSYEGRNPWLYVMLQNLLLGENLFAETFSSPGGSDLDLTLLYPSHFKDTAHQNLGHC